MNKAYESALRLLSRREHGAVELSTKLEKKGFNKLEVKQALEACQKLDLQSDSRFVENYSRSRIRQGYGPIKIYQELKSKGIDGDLIKNILSLEQDNWLSYAMEVWQKKSKSEGGLSFEEIQKQQRFLEYRGFGRDIIAQVVREVGN